MRIRKFREFVEATDLFGFDREKPKEEDPNSASDRPIDRFNIEGMMDFLEQKSIGVYEADLSFPNVIQWGHQPGAVKLEIDTGYRFFVKKLGIDKIGNPRWITKKLFQLNRGGFGGYEDAVAQEVFEHLEEAAKCMIEAPTEDYRDLENLTTNIYHKLKRTAKPIFIPEGVRKIHDDAYIIKFGVRAQGVEARDHMRIEQNQTLISFDREQGTIRITNYNLLSRVGRAHEFKINQNDLDVYFFPSQDRDEISEVIATRMKYY